MRSTYHAALLNLYIELGETQRTVTVAWYPFPPVHGPKGLADLVARALELVPAGSCDERRLLTRYAMLMNQERVDDQTA